MIIGKSKKDIVLNKAQNIILSPSYFEDLLLYKGQTLITTDGTTLLGADDKAGITEIVLATSYLSEVFTPYFGDGSKWGIKIKYAVEKEPLGTGGALINAYNKIENEFFLFI